MIDDLEMGLLRWALNAVTYMLMRDGLKEMRHTQQRKMVWPGRQKLE